MTLIKVCGVTRPEDALIAAREGADFIGMVLSSGFPRSVSLEKAKEIVEAAREGGAEPVGLFTQETQEQMEEKIEALSLKWVQLHTPMALKEGKALSCKRLLVNTNKYPHFKEGDFYLYDKYAGLKEERSWFLAGGLTPQNVRERIRKENPTGVDVSSGVEKEEIGIKDEELLISFIRAVKYG